MRVNAPSSIFVDQDYNLYVSDRYNHCVMKWMKDAKEGMIVAGGTGEQAHQLSGPTDFLFDAQGDLYVVDCNNVRIQKFRIDEINE